MATTQIRGNTQIINGTIVDAQINASAAIATSKLADGANFLKKDGSVAMTGNFDAGSQKLINVATPTSGTDAANKSYVDNVAQGLTPKPTANVATTGVLAANTYANGTAGVGATLTATANAALVVDGYTVVAGDRVLVKNEATTSHNGLYDVTQAGSVSLPYILTRNVDMDTSAEFVGSMVPVGPQGASSNANTIFICGTTGSVTVGTTGISFTQILAPSSYSAGNGVTITGNVIAVGLTSSGGLAFTGATVGVQLADATLTLTGSGLKLSSLTNGHILVGNGSSVATDVAMTGDVSITNTGVTTVNTTSGSGFTKYTSHISRETPTGSVNGSNVTFTLANTPVTGTEEVYLNGLLQEPGAGNDYTISAATITYLTAPVTGDRLRVSYRK